MPRSTASPPPSEFLAWCQELLSVAGTVRSRRMFGGHGLYVDGLFVAILMRDQLYLKADALSQGRYEDAGCPRFTYASARGTGQLGFYQAPAEALDDPQAMRPWARLALDSALRARASSPPAARRRRRADPPSTPDAR
ncbi:TfoX/Sxy family protein [Ideonella livida]|uniref:TfoX/Sxy family protein n=1 Tax=Ideonella livida TaxID=2707176 RepID=A0A7C9PJ95_9BURK|nr:TfoX/Sxy family protein [Ideonella livida]NDY92611.1 TfoX/Sxy family protein [Ideonella livida]